MRFDLLPFGLLRRAWRDNCQDWSKKCRKVEAKNTGYTSVSLAVPREVLLAAISEAMGIRWTA